MRKNKQFQLNVGASTILLIFVVLCLISFAVLSFVSANADYKLSSKILKRNTSYYEACNQAELSLANIDNTLENIYSSTSSEDEYFKMAGGDTISYTYEISDTQSLSLKLKILYPESSNGPFYKIICWDTINTNSLEYNDNINFFIK